MLANYLRYRMRYQIHFSQLLSSTGTRRAAMTMAKLLQATSCVPTSNYSYLLVLTAALCLRWLYNKGYPKKGQNVFFKKIHLSFFCYILSCKIYKLHSNQLLAGYSEWNMVRFIYLSKFVKFCCAFAIKMHLYLPQRSNISPKMGSLPFLS